MNKREALRIAAVVYFCFVCTQGETMNYLVRGDFDRKVRIFLALLSVTGFVSAVLLFQDYNWSKRLWWFVAFMACCAWMLHPTYQHSPPVSVAGLTGLVFPLAFFLGLGLAYCVWGNAGHSNSVLVKTQRR